MPGAWARVSHVPDNNPPLPDFTRWPSFPFEGDMRVKALADPVAVEPPRSGEDATDCVACNTPDDAYIWVSDRWRVRAMDRPTGLPVVLILECRSHLDLGDLPNLLAAELGVMTVRLERAIRSLDGVARVHVNRWGDGSAHLHMWFLARPYGRLQLRGTFLSLWDDILPVVPEQQWRESLALVAAWLGEFGGRAIAEPPHIAWQAPSTISDSPTASSGGNGDASQTTAVENADEQSGGLNGAPGSHTEASGGESAHSQPGGESAHSQPGGESVHDQPGGESVHDQPDGQSAHDQPDGQSAHDQPGGESANIEPLGGDPAHNEPGGGQPAQTAAGGGQAPHSDTADGSASSAKTDQAALCDAGISARPSDARLYDAGSHDVASDAAGSDAAAPGRAKGGDAGANHARTECEGTGATTAGPGEGATAEQATASAEDCPEPDGTESKRPSASVPGQPSGEASEPADAAGAGT
ncbi:hypothetical protein KRMM14A1004_62430 [Krasilnikovia sp. MM14-A1004]